MICCEVSIRKIVRAGIPPIASGDYIGFILEKISDPALAYKKPEKDKYNRQQAQQTEQKMIPFYFKTAINLHVSVPGFLIFLFSKLKVY